MMTIFQLPGILSSISFHKDMAELDTPCQGAEAIKTMLEEVQLPLEAIEMGLEKRRNGKWQRDAWQLAESNFNDFLLRMAPIRTLSSQVYFILHYIDKSSILPNEEKKRFNRIH